MTIEELAKSKVNSIPNSKLVKYYEAALPQYHMEVILTMLKKKTLSLLQEFILKFVAAGINDIADIRTFLGINSSAINNAIAVLQKENMLSVDVFKLKIRLTDKGEGALKEAATIIPEKVEYAIYVDGLLGTIYLDTKRLYTRKDVKNFDLIPVIPDIEKPTIDFLVYENVKRAINLFKKNHAYERDRLDGDLQEVSSVEKTYVEYKKVSVLVFMNDKTGDIELQVYDGVTRNDEYGIALQKLYNNNTKVFNFDSKQTADETDEHPLMNILPREIIENAKAFTNKNANIDKEISNLTTQLTEIRDNIQDEEERESSTERIRFLEQRIAEMENERRGADRILSTYDHRPLLINALENAQNCVVIISPWIKSGGLNNQILDLIDKAIQRGTRVVIGYGIGEKEDSDKRILNSLESIQKKQYGKYLELIRLSNTHEKVLIKDNEFIVITSFNWLSFKGDPNKGFRQETGFYTESKEVIAQMKANLSQEKRLGVEL